MTDYDRDYLTRAEGERRFVSIDRYLPVERLVYGGVTIALSAVLLGLLAFVVRGR